MMIRQKRFLTAALAAACSTALVLTACGSPTNAGNTSTAAGEPVSGGNGRFIQLSSEPRSLDPAGLGNNWGTHAIVGNALYGTLMTNNVETFEVEYTMAEDFTTTDGGNTFTLKLLPGLRFSDGTPLDADAVKVNWDRMADPALGSNSARYAKQITENEVIDATTLKSTMATPNPHFAQTIVISALNWIASPTALNKGPAAFDKAPIGAGPFTLTDWTRQDAIELARNPEYWDAPKPYLDTLTVRSSSDTNQRFNAVSTGVADLATTTSWETLDKAEAAGLPTEIVPMGGGQYLAMNFRRAPFDDERARRAVSLATDINALNMTVYNGKAQIPETLFAETSPYFTDIALAKTDKNQAQKLFDELAAEGKPVSFTLTTTANTDAKMVAETLQAQLRAFKNVDVKINIIDSTANLALYGSHDFDMTITASNIQDPDADLTTGFHGDSPANLSGINDPQLNDALAAGRVAETEAERTAAYEIVQERIAALTPGIWYIRPAPSVFTGINVHGVQMYGTGSLLPEELWITK